MFVIDPRARSSTTGAIDDKPTTDRGRRPGSDELRRRRRSRGDAGKPVTTADDAPYGCGVKYGSASRFARASALAGVARQKASVRILRRHGPYRFPQGGTRLRIRVESMAGRGESASEISSGISVPPEDDRVTAATAQFLDDAFKIVSGTLFESSVHQLVEDDGVDPIAIAGVWASWPTPTLLSLSG